MVYTLLYINGYIAICRCNPQDPVIKVMKLNGP